MRHAGVDFLFEIVDVFFQRCRLRMLFWIAGAVDLHARTLLADVHGQVAGMFEHSCRFGTVDAVTTQGEYAGDFGLFEHVECLVDVILVQILRGQMGHAGDAVFAYRVGDARGQRTVG